MSLKLANNVFPVFLVLVLCSLCRSVVTLILTGRTGVPWYLSFILMFKVGWIAIIHFMYVCKHIDV